jgi:hypothetical protein
MIRANVNITIVEGGTFNKTFQWKSGDPSVAVDLTEYEGNMQVRAKVKSEEVLIEVPFQAEAWVADGLTGVYIYDSNEVLGDLGKFRVYIKDEDTAGVCALHKDIVGAYDCFLTTSEGETVLQLYGTATIIAAVTR